jgi:hypothetical protein
MMACFTRNAAGCFEVDVWEVEWFSRAECMVVFLLESEWDDGRTVSDLLTWRDCAIPVIVSVH